MPTINKRKICNKHGFYDAITNASCPQCKKQSNKTYDKTLRAQDRKKIYNSKKWAIVREQAIIRDKMMCVPCYKKGIKTLATEVHHIIELSEDISLAYELSNLQSICHSCHMKEHH